ncbi:unnamed protein product [Sphacelaria rigidula]
MSAVRELEYMHPVKSRFPGMPSHAKTFKTQRIHYDADSDRLNLIEESRFKGIPYANYFSVHTHWAVHPVQDATDGDDDSAHAMDGHRGSPRAGRTALFSEVSVAVGVSWKKRTVLRGKIEKQTLAEHGESLQHWATEAAVACRSLFKDDISSHADEQKANKNNSLSTTAPPSEDSAEDNDPYVEGGRYPDRISSDDTDGLGSAGGGIASDNSASAGAVVTPTRNDQKFEGDTGYVNTAVASINSNNEGQQSTQEGPPQPSQTNSQAHAVSRGDTVFDSCHNDSEHEGKDLVGGSPKSRVGGAVNDGDDVGGMVSGGGVMSGAPSSSTHEHPTALCGVGNSCAPPGVSVTFSTTKKIDWARMILGRRFREPSWWRRNKQHRAGCRP